ncbi:MAG: DUF1549 domain-containing protein [Planctomycetales bacterium]|nr:DUF1549 domain-containing protein [Planctomycetales bacterium]
MPGPRSWKSCWHRPTTASVWGRHWLDVARCADSGGYETDICDRNAWRYGDYFVKSLNDDKPYDRFVQKQIAPDKLWPDNLHVDVNPKRVYHVSAEKPQHLEALTGTGFYALAPQVHESGLDATKLRMRGVNRLGRHDRTSIPGTDCRLRAMPRPKVRDGLAARLLCPAGSYRRQPQDGSASAHGHGRGRLEAVVSAQ